MKRCAILLVLLCLLGSFMELDAAMTGRVMVNKAGRQRKLTFGFLLKSFFGTLFDPTYSGEIKVSKPSAAKGKASKGGKKQKLGSPGVFGEGGAAIGGGSFGPVCGPNGCS